MSDFIRHEACPECKSKDNVGVYENGKFCFGCGWYERIKKLKDTVIPFTLYEKGKKKTTWSKDIKMPTDAQRAIPLIPKVWLQKYDILESEIRSNDIHWSEQNKYLIFPVYNINVNIHTLIMWQARNFRKVNEGLNKKRPKYITIGPKEEIDHIMGDWENLSILRGRTLVIVEDIISAIKIARFMPVMPLFGSTFSQDKAIRIEKDYKNLILWLDQDKHAAAIKLSEKYKYLFRDIGVISTKKDPKEVSPSEIREKLKWHQPVKSDSSLIPPWDWPIGN